MGMDSNIKNGNRKWLVFCLGSGCLCGTLSGAVNKKPSDPKTFAKANLNAAKSSSAMQLQLALFKQGIASRRKEVKEKLKRAFELSGMINMPMWKNIAEQEAKARWKDLNKLIGSFKGPRDVVGKPGHIKPTIVDPQAQFLESLYKFQYQEFSKIEGQGAKKKFLEKLSLPTLVDLWQHASDDEKLAIFPHCPPLFQAVVFGELIQTRPEIGRQLLGYLPVLERVLYYLLLDDNFQKASFYFLPLTIQKRLEKKFHLTPATLLPDSEQIEL
ncbi:MAG: hypothetical protein LW808_002355 [Verrucomicrobiota bacterium]|nr:MAG: hypothetical protein LW808_002355 [Verrucomicrobiota bacterium]